MNEPMNLNMGDPNLHPPVASPVVAPPVYEPPSSTPLMGNQYGQPVISPPLPPQPMVGPGQPNPIIVNQQSPALVLQPDIFKSTSIVITCPFCNRNISTSIRETFNCATCCLCFFTFPLLYICIQLLRNKDLCCYDVDHSCPYCNNRLGTYSSC